MSSSKKQLLKVSTTMDNLTRKNLHGSRVGKNQWPLWQIHRTLHTKPQAPRLLGQNFLSAPTRPIPEQSHSTVLQEKEHVKRSEVRLTKITKKSAVRRKDNSKGLRILLQVQVLFRKKIVVVFFFKATFRLHFDLG